ncbi:unnamed protein product [Penicillium olsonii]|nr:unnamed protein product [Penicillium olsonii]CAG7932587.1 unnamed protein product [Penicillium olsonii]CAG8084683.1 unnamed protein product [Penicillium olsonii]
MHLPPSHAVRDLPTLHAFIQQHPLGVLTTSLPGKHPTLQCSHIPWVLDDVSAPPEINPSNGVPEPSLGILRGHIARANPQGKAMIEASRIESTPMPGTFPTDEPQSPSLGHTLPEEALIIFTSPVDHYISPNLYTDSKPGGRVAPTWNYAAVQVYGHVTLHHDTQDPHTESFLRQQLGDLARLGEEGIMGYEGTSPQPRSNGLGSASAASPKPWEIADAPGEYIAALLKNIIGMRIEITRIEGRFKVSQEKGAGDRGGVVEGLQGMGGMATNMADFVRRGRVLDPSARGIRGV